MKMIVVVVGSLWAKTIICNFFQKLRLPHKSYFGPRASFSLFMIYSRMLHPLPPVCCLRIEAFCNNICPKVKVLDGCSLTNRRFCWLSNTMYVVIYVLQLSKWILELRRHVWHYETINFQKRKSFGVKSCIRHNLLKLINCD